MVATPHTCLVVQPQHLVDGIDDEPVWLSGPYLDDIFVGREATKHLEPAGEVVGRDELGDVRL